jgi:hypothetical protein
MGGCPHRHPVVAGASVKKALVARAVASPFAVALLIAYIGIGVAIIGLYIERGRSTRADSALVRENEERSKRNKIRQQRNCERIAALVEALDKLTPDIRLTVELAKIDARYPEVEPCPNEEGGNP